MLASVVIASLWVLSEYLRAILLQGFSWNIGYTQSFNIPVIQISDVTGSYGVVFFIILLNASIYHIIKKQRVRFHIGLIFISTVFVISYGSSAVSPAIPEDDRPVKVALIQGNIDQEKKWDEAFVDEIMSTYEDLSLEASKEQPELVIWPETAMPGYWMSDDELRPRLEHLLKKIDATLLFGTAVVELENNYNSAVLMAKDGHIRGVYSKIHLVPFAEIIRPKLLEGVLRDKLGFKVGSYTNGGRKVVFDFDRDFGVVICSEDFYPGLIRKLVDNGSRFVINITNDARISASSAPVLHLQASILRAVENRIPVIRCANSGPSCFIDDLGNIKSPVERHEKRLNIAGYSVESVGFRARKAVYTRKGDIFSLCCVIIFIVSEAVQILSSRVNL